MCIDTSSFITLIKMTRFVAVLVFLLTIISPASSEPKCCMLNKWEGLVYFGIGAVDKQNSSGIPGSDKTDLYITNGTVHVSYDQDNGLTYIGFDRYTRSVQSPPERSRGSLITNYKTKFQYLVYENGTCERSQLTDNMTVYCASDFLKNDNFPMGRIVGATPVTNIEVLPGSFFSSIYTTTYQDGAHCMPLYLAIVNNWPGSDGAGAGGADVLDIKEGISDPSVFTPPPNCSKQISEKSKDPVFLWLSSFFG
ncbi:uncharacterized protein LOC110464252 [Mizuhopecten yessoensis]|uniref:Mammalian ependymin-related protein 1 n=1 Tax=Mizuhopecten yessoensis TaxID=6573 RepID=A0A210PUG7_MIZYE|nr:uncharacterized protein LOC110464252 [Mizuhopecten yessoensis]OWF40094.1 hypothetical protein KP79_PYT06494 [Mizuhopecten yessoensis]